MKPCPRCGTAIPNKAATCDQCVGKPPALQLAPCRTMPQAELDHAIECLADATDGDDMTLVAMAVAGVLTLPLALCYVAAGAAGLTAALVLGATLLVLYWSATGGGC